MSLLWYKGALIRIHNVFQMGFDYISNSFSHNLMDNITKGDRVIIRGFIRVKDFRNKTYKGLIKVRNIIVVVGDAIIYNVPIVMI